MGLICIEDLSSYLIRMDCSNRCLSFYWTAQKIWYLEEYENIFIVSYYQSLKREEIFVGPYWLRIAHKAKIRFFFVVFVCLYPHVILKIFLCLAECVVFNLLFSVNDLRASYHILDIHTLFWIRGMTGSKGKYDV